MRTSIATVCLSGTLEEKLQAAATAGFDGVEIFEQDLVVSPNSPEAIAALAAELGLSLDLYQPFRDFEGVDDEQFAANLVRAEAKFQLMRRLGMTTILLCSNVATATIDDDEVVVDQLRSLGDLAEKYGIDVAYEALAWGRFVSEYDRAWDLVKAADHPRIGTCLDSFHILSRGTDLSRIAEIPGEKIFFLQLADAPRMAMDVLQWSRHYRCFPGQGGFDLTGFTDHVLAAGYTGPLSLEVFNDVFRASDARRTAADAMRSLSLLEDSLGRDPEGPRPKVEPRRLPEPVRPSGYAFVEVAAGAASAGRVRTILSALGFAHTHDHRSKPVQLWRHGDARVLLNSTDPRLGHTWSGPASVTALGVAVPDPEGAVERAGRLLAPALPRRRDPAESELRAVAAPDGTAVFFCAEGEGGPDWTADFSAPAVHDRVEEAAPGAAHIDHVGLFQPFDHFDEASLFYRSLFGLTPDENVEMAGPDGLVRSRALAGRGTGPRVVLNVSVLGRGAEGDAEGGAQHVALSCEDVFAAAEAMRATGVEPLPIPDNYYDDLACRTDLRPDTLERMRENGVLYDRDDDGEFWHFYTATVDGRLFFEVVQRIGGYDGYGSANSAVRMAAQRSEVGC